MEGLLKMDLHQLKIFVEVVRQKNFSRAAEKIFLSQPTVSAHIKALENEIGAPLLDRSRQELRVTDSGEILFKYAQQLLNLEKKAIFAIQEKSQFIKGHLEVASSSVPGTYILPTLMKSFVDIHPGVTFSVMLRGTQHVYESVLNHTYDLGFVGDPSTSNDLRQIKFLNDELILIVPPKAILPEAVLLEELKDANYASNNIDIQVMPSEIDLKTKANAEFLLDIPFVMREPGSATRLVFENALQKFLRKKKVALNIVAYIEGQEAIKEAVKSGLGVSIISHKAVKEELYTGALKGYRIPDLNLWRYFYIIYRKNCIMSPLSQTFLNHFINSFKQRNQ